MWFLAARDDSDRLPAPVATPLDGAPCLAQQLVIITVIIIVNIIIIITMPSVGLGLSLGPIMWGVLNVSLCAQLEWDVVA